MTIIKRRNIVMRTILLAAVDYAIAWAVCVLACGLLSLFLPLSDPLRVGSGFWVLYGFIDLLIPDEKKLRNRWKT